MAYDCLKLLIERLENTFIALHYQRFNTLLYISFDKRLFPICDSFFHIKNIPFFIFSYALRCLVRRRHSMFGVPRRVTSE